MCLGCVMFTNPITTFSVQVQRAAGQAQPAPAVRWGEVCRHGALHAGAAGADGGALPLRGRDKPGKSMYGIDRRYPQ